MSVLNTLERDDVIESTICFACAVATWQFTLRFFYLNPTKATKERLPQNPMETIKAETAQNISPRRFQLGTPESLQKPNQRPCQCQFIHNGEGWEGWEKLDILWSSWHFFGVEYVFLPCFLHTSRAFPFNSMHLCQDLERSTSKWHLLVWGPGFGTRSCHFLALPVKNKNPQPSKKELLDSCFYLEWLHIHSGFNTSFPHHLIFKHFYNMT